MKNKNNEVFADVKRAPHANRLEKSIQLQLPINELDSNIAAVREFRGEYALLSNFALSPVKLGGVLYPTAEHAYQAAKTTDEEERLMVWQCRTAADAKHLGDIVTKREGWEDIKQTVMKAILVFKFTHNTNARLCLMKTGKRELIKGNYWHDNFWGTCTCLRCRGEKACPRCEQIRRAHQQDPPRNCRDCMEVYGANNLGKLLMEVREEIRNGVHKIRPDIPLIYPAKKKDQPIKLTVVREGEERVDERSGRKYVMQLMSDGSMQRKYLDKFAMTAVKLEGVKAPAASMANASRTSTQRINQAAVLSMLASPSAKEIESRRD